MHIACCRRPVNKCLVCSSSCHKSLYSGLCSHPPPFLLVQMFVSTCKYYSGCFWTQRVLLQGPKACNTSLFPLSCLTIMFVSCSCLFLAVCLPIFSVIAWSMAGGDHLSPWAPDISTCARSFPAFSALSRHTVHQVSIRFAADMTVMGSATAATRPWTTNCSTRYLPASMVTCAMRMRASVLKFKSLVYLHCIFCLVDVCMSVFA